jgi:hypothetical protein
MLSKNFFVGLCLCIFFPFISYAQEQIQCEKVSAIAIEAVNKKNSFELEKYLASDFSMLGHKGSVAFLVLPASIKKITDHIEDSKFVQYEQKEGSLKLPYLLRYRDMNEKKTFFVCNKKNLLVELEFFEAKVEATKNS